MDIGNGSAYLSCALSNLEFFGRLMKLRMGKKFEEE